MQAALYEFLKNKNECEVVLCKNDKEAKLLHDASVYSRRKTFVLPDFRARFGDDLKPYQSELFELLSELGRYNKENSSKKVLISPIRTALLPLPNEELFQSFTINFGDKVDFVDLKNKLIHWGYTFVDVVETNGEVSFRGDILDIFTNNANNAIRISFLYNEVESIRYFETQTQKSIKDEIDSFEITPALFSLNEKDYASLDKKIQNIDSDSFSKDILSLGFWALGDRAKSYISRKKTYFATNMQNEIEDILLHNENIHEEQFANILTIPLPNEYKDLEVSKVSSFLEFHKTQKITILAANEVLLKQAEINIAGNVEFEESTLVLNLTSDRKIIISLNKEVKKKRRKIPSILIDELKIGDYVVHENYGIGIFKGLVNTTVLGVKKDFIELLYQGDDKLLLPVENINVIDRYIADSGALAVIDKLGKGSFLKLKEKTRVKLFEIAKEIIEVAAKRELIQGFSVNVEDESIVRFSQSSGFTYTDDQKRSINEILENLSSGKVMDRLLSGDVGFGKTEVAMNALLATAKSNFQSLMIVPTTLLSSQHYKSITNRFKGLNINIAKLDRFTSSREKSKILKDLQDGTLHICIGTHSLLSVSCKNLALVIIDEEHKFGVKQKEKLKNLRENIHILSMSATPIPRSLNMALSSIKQYSQILTPPEEREDVKTFVKEYDEKLVREVIHRELRRGGQVFYIHNRIASIKSKEKELKAILPNIKVLILHSKIGEEQTEDEMIKFENKEYDILLSTSIVESGIHLPNVNTIIVESSDKFGIADLHQLRGRVGRGKNQGFCYFIVENKETLSEASQKRLVALESNSFLGSGSVLAYHDLEIRGGGNLIGEAQSGHIKQIGYSLYLRMLEDTINELLNKIPIKKKDVDLKLLVSAFINDAYIREDRVRLELYRRLSRCESVSEVYDIEEELNDRFGKPDKITLQFLSLIIIKILASQIEVKSIYSYQQTITFAFNDGEKIAVKARSKDDDDVINSTMEFLRSKINARRT